MKLPGARRLILFPAVQTAGQEKREVRLRGLEKESAQADFALFLAPGFSYMLPDRDCRMAFQALTP